MQDAQQRPLPTLQNCALFSRPHQNFSSMSISLCLNRTHHVIATAFCAGCRLWTKSASACGFEYMGIMRVARLLRWPPDADSGGAMVDLYAGATFAGASPGRHARARYLRRGPGHEPPPLNFPPSERVAPSVLKVPLSSGRKVGGCPSNSRCSSWAITSTTETKKAPEPVPSLSGWFLAPELNSLAFVDIQDDLTLAVPAVYQQAPCLSLRSWDTINRLLRLQRGHEIHPFFTDSLTADSLLFKLFSSFPPKRVLFPLDFKIDACARAHASNSK